MQTNSFQQYIGDAYDLFSLVWDRAHFSVISIAQWQASFIRGQQN